MTIEELEQLIEYIDILPIDSRVEFDYQIKIIEIIKAEIARQSVTDEDVQRAKNWIEEYYKFWHQLSTQKELEVFETILTALQQMNTEPCNWCKNNPEMTVQAVHEIKGFEGNLYLGDISFCPVCGRKLR